MKFCSECGHRGRAGHPRRRQPAAPCVHAVRHDSLPEPENGDRLHSRLGTRTASCRCCCAGARSSRAMATGRCRPASWKTAKRPAEAAMRETEEEAGANIEIGPLFTLLNVAHVHQVHMFYLARLLDLDFAPGEESLDVQLFDEREIPWDDLAFPTIRTTLELFFADRVKMREGGSAMASIAMTSCARCCSTRTRLTDEPHDPLARGAYAVSRRVRGADDRRARPARSRRRPVAAAPAAGLPERHLPLVLRRPAHPVVEHRSAHGAA